MKTFQPNCISTKILPFSSFVGMHHRVKGHDDPTTNQTQKA